MVNTSREGNKSLEIFENSSNNYWKFSSNDLEHYLTRLKFHLNHLEPSADVFLSKIRLLIYNILQGTYKKSENQEIIDFFSSVQKTFIDWAKSVSIQEVHEVLNYATFQCFAKINIMITGLESYYYKFHESIKKYAPKNYKSWPSSNLKSNTNALSSFFINFFGKCEGFDLFFKILLSE